MAMRSKCSGSCWKREKQQARHTNGTGHGGASHDRTPAATARFHTQESGGSSTEGGTEAVAVGDAQERATYTPARPTAYTSALTAEHKKWTRSTGRPRAGSGSPGWMKLA